MCYFWKLKKKRNATAGFYVATAVSLGERRRVFAEYHPIQVQSAAKVIPVLAICVLFLSTNAASNIRKERTVGF